MTSARIAAAVAAIVTVSFAAGAGAMWAAQQQQTSHREPQFENSELKVWKSVIMPKQPLTLHRHDHGRALIALTDGQLDVVDKNGKRLGHYDWKQGKAYWLGVDPPGQMHADVNNTTKPVEVIVVELKNDTRPGN
jgi:quercetin dioxygenase-like cupin family protein